MSIKKRIAYYIVRLNSHDLLRDTKREIRKFKIRQEKIRTGLIEL